MRAPDLGGTECGGRPLAASLYLRCAAGERSSHTGQFAGGLVADFRAVGEPIGVALTMPDRTSVTGLNLVLATACQLAEPPTLTAARVAPLRAASTRRAARASADPETDTDRFAAHLIAEGGLGSSLPVLIYAARGI